MAEVFGNLNNPNVLVIGVFHGDEPQGNYLIREYVKQNPKTNLLMLPCLNKSGYDKGNRVNANGVDLNRNFPTKNWENSKFIVDKLPILLYNIKRSREQDSDWV